MGEMAEELACSICGAELPNKEYLCCRASNENAGEEIPFKAEILMSSGDKLTVKSRWTKIGREKDNDIVLRDDGFVSRYHAWITVEQERFWVEDLGSTNGTLLNGQLLERRELLASGDKIKIGDSEMTFVLLDKTG